MKKNSSGSVSVQILRKEKGRTILVETIGCSKKKEELKKLEQKGRWRIEELLPQQKFDLFSTHRDTFIKQYLQEMTPVHVVCRGPELILGHLFDEIGLSIIPEELFRHIILARLTYPVSKLKTSEYLERHHGISISADQIYRFLDRFHKKYKEQVEKIVFDYSKTILKQISVVFYDMTTLYFEAEDEDDLRKIGFSKDGKFQSPQIMVGLLVGENGFPIGYDIFEGNTYEGHTLIPVIEAAQKKYNLPKPIVIADSGLLSNENIQKLMKQGYEFILGARIKNETRDMQKKILQKAKGLKNGESVVIEKPGSTKKERDQSAGHRLIVSFSEKRAKKDAYNREKGLKKLRERIKSGKLTKENINNRGYNKFLLLKNEVRVSFDETKIEEEKKWDGLKGYLTNSKLLPERVITHYKQLWEIERAFRISKTDLRIRPIFHYRKRRIEAHLCIAFAAYAVYKELERKLKEVGSHLSSAKAIELSKTIYELSFLLPDSGETRKTLSHLSEGQKILLSQLGYFG